MTYNISIDHCDELNLINYLDKTIENIINTEFLINKKLKNKNRIITVLKLYIRGFSNKEIAQSLYEIENNITFCNSKIQLKYKLKHNPHLLINLKTIPIINKISRQAVFSIIKKYKNILLNLTKKHLNI